MASSTTEKSNGSNETKKRVQPPNKEEFQKNLAELEKELRLKEKDVEAARNAVRKMQGGNGNGNGSNDERTKLRAELDQLKKKQNDLKIARNKIMDEVKLIDERCKRKIKDLQNQKSKVNFKSTDDIDAQIKKLERAVESNSLKLVDEKKHLAEISALKKAKKNFGSFADAQASIDEDKARISELKKSIDNTEANATSERYNQVTGQLDKLRDEQQAAYKNRSTLYDNRSNAEKARDQVRNQIKELKDTYYDQVRKFGEQRKAEQQARIEREKAEKAAYEKEKKVRVAKEKLEEANEPAFATEIATAENLLLHFDPEFKKSGDSTGTNGDKFVAKATRSVEQVPTNAKIIKKETPAFFAGSANAKKGNKKASKPSGSEKFSINIGIVEDLHALNVTVPASKDDVQDTIEQLKKKIEYFKENEARVTTERVEKAKAELAKLDLEDN